MLGAGLIGVCGAYALNRGVRFPPLSLQRHPPLDEVVIGGLEFSLQDLLVVPLEQGPAVNLRAFAPEPELRVSLKAGTDTQLMIHNIWPQARMLAESSNAVSISEVPHGINRQVVISAEADSALELRWQLPALPGYRFAAIGDTGAGEELQWCLQRAHQLGASFLLLLGDFNYQPGDYQRAIAALKQSPLPCYVSIGNHDFHDDGLLVDQYLQNIGPLNHQFDIGATRFLNLDTAAGLIPYWGGRRAALLESAATENKNYNDTVVFTHRPLHDPTPSGSHDMGSERERDWFIDQLKAVNARHLLSGHIHIFDRSEFQGIDNIIVGQGTGHQDLIVNADHSKMAIGEVDASGRVSYRMAPLAMPMELHCHPRSDVVKQSLQDSAHADVIRAIDESCRKRAKNTPL